MSVSLSNSKGNDARELQGVGDEMQQKLSERKVLLCKEAGPTCGVAFLQLPFRCPRCGEHQKLRGLSSLRAYFEHGHVYHTVHSLSPASGWWDPSDRLQDGRPGDAGCTEKCRSVAPLPGETGEPTGSDAAETGAGKADWTSPNDSAEEERPGATQIVAVGGGQAQPGLEDSVPGGDSSMARRLRRVSSELAQVDMELLRAHARFQHLAREKLQVSERERALGRQVDAAVVEIGRLREQLSLSEQELEKKEMEVVSIHSFLEAAAQHEMCGKVRLQRFIENLLQRIALAERLLQYYHGISNLRSCTNYMVSRIPGHVACLCGGQRACHPKRKVFSKPFPGEAGIQAQLLSVGAHMRGGVKCKEVKVHLQCEEIFPQPRWF